MRKEEEHTRSGQGLKTIAILSSCMDDWGGCEELWARSIPLLQQRGLRFIVFKEKINNRHPEYVALAQRGVQLIELDRKPSVRKRLTDRGTRILKKVLAKTNFPIARKTEAPFTIQLKVCQPDLVIISQAINFDALPYAYQCLSLGVPYVLVSQKAVDFYWPAPEDRAYMIRCFQQARKCFFVSRHNLRITEEQFGTRLANSQVIYNPVKIAPKVLPFPAVEPAYKLACVGRLFLLDKGQDILIRVLSEEQWKNRPLIVSFIGSGPDEEGLRAMAALLQVQNIEFKGQVHDMEHLWREYHALVLPSRGEGLPLVILEAMAAGRPVIISDAGGNAEVVEEGITGFIGQANEASFGAAMERAWQQRHLWEDMGKKACSYITEKIPTAPEETFANYIKEIIHD